MTDSPQLLARLDASPLKRWVTLLITSGVGVALIYFAASKPPSATGTILMLAAAVFLLWSSHKIYHATQQSVILSEAGLMLDDGTILAEIANIESVDRGFSALKPSNGFAIRLHKPGPRGWSPGVWWRMGRQMGFGGTTNRDQARMMADMLKTLIDEAPRQS